MPNDTTHTPTGSESKPIDWIEQFMAEEAAPYQLTQEQLSVSRTGLGSFMWMEDVDFIVRKAVKIAPSHAPSPTPITEEMVERLRAVGERFDHETDPTGSTWVELGEVIALLREQPTLPVTDSAPHLSGITEEMVERVVNEFIGPIGESFDRTGYDDGAEYAALEIKDRLIALLREQGQRGGE